MRKLFCLLLAFMLLPIFPVYTSAEDTGLSVSPLAEAIRPGKAFLLSFTVPQDGICDLTLRDMAGNYVMDVVRELHVSAGTNMVWWNGTAMGAAPDEGVYQLFLSMSGDHATSTVVIGPHAPYLTSIVPVKDAQAKTMTVDFYVSVEGLLTVGLWSSNAWSLLENREVKAGMNQLVWDANTMKPDTTALTLTLTDSTGYSSNEEHIIVHADDFGLVFATPTPMPTPEPTATAVPVPDVTPFVQDPDVPVFIDPSKSQITPIPTEEPTPEPTEVPTPEPTEVPTPEPTEEPTPEPTEVPTPEPTEVPTPEPTEVPTPEPTEEPTPEPTEVPTPEPTTEPTAEPTAEVSSDWDTPIEIDSNSAEAVEEAEPAETPVPTEDITYTPSYGSPYAFTEKDQGTYWATPMDITDEAAVWQMLTAPITVFDATYKGQKKIYQEPDDKSRVVGVVTGTSQGVRVIENLDNGWSLIECYSSTFHDNSIQAWNMLVQGYVKTSSLKTHDVTDKYHIVVDKLTQRLYLFGEGKLLTTLLVSTGLSNERQPYNETRSGEFLYISATGGFWSDNMFAPMGMKFNDGDLLHEVPYVQRSGSNSRIYSSTEPYLGQRASHGCIRVQRKENSDGYNMEWIWDNRKDIGRLVVWEDWQGRQVSYPADDTILYYNADGGSYYHKAEKCASAKDSVVFTTFTYTELDTGDFAELEFCPYCAPALRKAEIDAINQAHAVGGDHDPILTQARQKYLDKLVEKHGLEALTPGELRYYTPAAQ